MGNPILTDDAIGVRLAGEAARELAGTDGLDVIEECSVGGLNLIDVFSGYQRVVALDAIHTRGGRVGDWYHFTAARLRPTAHLSNVHDANLATALALGRALGIPLPDDERIHVLAVEIEDDETFGTELSPALARAYPDCRVAILAELRRILGLSSRSAPDPGAFPAGP
jgi:hydrogenase maturation protease